MLIINTKYLCGEQTKHKHVHMFKRAFQLTIYFSLFFSTSHLVYFFKVFGFCYFNTEICALCLCYAIDISDIITLITVNKLTHTQISLMK